MELPVARQAVEFTWAAALGLALGCWYDVLRALRRRHRRLTVPADGLYCLTVLFALLAFALYAGRGMMRCVVAPFTFVCFERRVWESKYTYGYR